ncbi:MAG: hypothetical protein H6Q00_464 [Holophagaceae bacterium]|nr:hypothetical protein [Holophagaceae bacterium]
MTDIHELLEQARRGDGGHTRELLAFLEGFERIVLRGAGRFGEAFGAGLIGLGIPPERLCYWDLRADALGAVNGVAVALPFSTELDRATTLIINCMPNGSLSGSAGSQEFLDAGYGHYLSGMALFEALMCRMTGETGFDPSICMKTTICNWCACERLPSLLRKHGQAACPNGFSDELVFPVATFVINQKCTLHCQHCGQYINHYGQAERINFPLERLKTDIDRIFEAVDGIGYVSIIGGEPFLHPELNAILDLILAKPNFGVIGVTTNGICDIKDEHLEKLRNDRCRLIFSDYTAVLSEQQRALFASNVERATRAGLHITVGQPLWATPASLRKLDLEDSVKAAMKAGCQSRHSCKTIQNGVYYPCSTTAGLGSHHLADHSLDWVRIDEARSARELRERIQMVDRRAFYESCDHCGEGGEMLQFAGEQGFCERYRHIGGPL